MMECEYCQGDKRIDTGSDDIEIIVRERSIIKVYEDGYGWYEASVFFNNCPMCGKKVRELSNDY